MKLWTTDRRTDDDGRMPEHGYTISSPVNANNYLHLNIHPKNRYVTGFCNEN